MSRRRSRTVSRDDDNEEIEYAEGWGEEYGKYSHLDLEPEHLEEESILTEYDADDFVSCAITSPDSTLPIDLFEFEHSYGYDCQKYFNLCACDDSVVCWSAGSLITFLDVTTKQMWFRRSTTGGSVGNIASYREDPNYRIAIAEAKESDFEPVIILYTWPQMEMDAVLREGTQNAYSILDFSPDGELLASIGKEPDFNITIWNWKRHKIMLRTSAFTYGVNNIMFSPYCPGQLTTAGLAHIKFWKMADTFTGLKLKGELGRFGKTEICDVLGIFPMPDEKVLSGCEWGNVLVWEAGLIKVEVTQRGRKVCHKAPIIQFMLSPAGDEVTTIARDGCIRAWYWDTVEQADPPEDDQFVELNPVAETCVPDCQIMCLKFQKDMYWFAQDGNGGIWIADLELDKIQCNHTKLMTFHAGAVVAMIAVRTHPLLITGGSEGAIMVYHTESHMLLARYVFTAPVTCMLYVPLEIDPTSRTILVGFADGMMRTLLLNVDKLLAQTELIEVRLVSTLTVHSNDTIHADVIDLVSWLKPHSKKLIQMSFNKQNTLLVTCGEDSTIFMYLVNKQDTTFSLERVGFIETPNVIAFMTWKPNKERVILLCGQVGLIMEAVLPPPIIQKYEEITTFKLEFESYKETLLKKNYMRRRPFPAEDDLASLDEEALKAAAEVDTSEDEKLDDEFIGEIQLIESESQLGTTVTWAEYCQDGVWVVQQGTGALFLITPGHNKIMKYAPIPNAWTDTLCTLRFLCDRRYLMIGTNNGYIRVLRMPTEEEDSPFKHLELWMHHQKDLMKRLKGRRLKVEEVQPTPYIVFHDYYYLQMHDRDRGQINCMEFSADVKYLYTCGKDGNIFSYVINFEEQLVPPAEVQEIEELPKVERVKEPSTLDEAIMSHEELKQKEEYDKMMAIANAHKKRVRDELAELTIEYNKLIKMNKLLPFSQQIDVTLDPRPLVVQESEIEEAKKLAIRKVAHQLEASDIGLWKMYSRNIIQLDVFPFTLKAIRDPRVFIRPFRQKNLSKDFWDQLEEVHIKMAEAALRMKRTESTARRAALKKMSWGPPRVASFLLGLPPNPPHMLKKQLRNYYQRLQRHHLQFIEWQEHLAQKPDPNALPPGAAEALREAELTIGNRLLKTDPDYVSPPGHNTQLRLCLCRQEVFNNKRAFNMKVLELREYKLKLVEEMKQIGDRLNEIRMEIPAKQAKQPPFIPTIDDEMEFPEKHLEVRPEPIVVQKKGVPPGRARKSTTDRTASTTFPQARIKTPKVPRFVPLTESRPSAAYWELLKPRADYTPTEMEIEIRERRIDRHAHEQDMLLADAAVSIQEFDARLLQLQRERIRVQEKNQLLELHLYKMHQEMNVLNRFEAHEDSLAERVYAKLIQVKGVQEQIEDCELRIEEHKAEKEELGLQCEQIQSTFKHLIQDNKFADFLRRIFKKKFRAPRDRDDDDESSEDSESSSSSEEEDEGSLDSRDIGPIRLDPTVCPEGCEQEVYDMTYEMRGTRHKLEQGMLEQDRLVELLKKDIEAHGKVKRKLTFQLDKRKKNLKDFMMEKQSCLNEIESVVILKYDQIRARALFGCTGPQGLSQTIVFPEKILSRLRARVLELQDEIKLARQRAKINRTHLFRMNIDLREMKRLAEELRAQMRDVLTKKLGRPRKVDKTLDDLLRQMARRHKYGVNLRIMPHMLAQFRTWKERHSDLEQKYLQAVDKYSNRLRLAAALQADVVPQPHSKDPSVMCGAYNIEHYQRDVVRLRIVRAQQLQEIEQLEEEIMGLKYKPLEQKFKPLPPPEMGKAPSEIWLYSIPPPARRARRKYFPLLSTSGSPQQSMSYDTNIMKLLYDSLDALKVSRDDANDLLKDLTSLLPSVITGQSSRFEVVDKLLRKWLLKYGGDPSQYKKQTRAFDALAALADRLIREHVEILEGATDDSNLVMDNLEAALKEISQEQGSEEMEDVAPLHIRLAPTLAALFHTAESDELFTEETLTALVNSLLTEDHPFTDEEIDKIDVATIVEDIQTLGVRVPEEEIERIVLLTVECLRAQLISPEEARAIETEVQRSIRTSTQHSKLVLQPAEPRISVSQLSDIKARSSLPSSRASFDDSSRRSKPKVSISSKVTLKDDEDADKTKKSETISTARSGGSEGTGGTSTEGGYGAQSDDMSLDEDE